MKNIALTSFIIMVSFNAWAGASLNSEREKLRALVDVGTNGGDTYLYQYNVEGFSYSKAIKEVVLLTNDSTCSYVVVRGRRQLVKSISAFASFANSSAAQKIVKRLILNNQVKAAVGYFWDGQEGDSEYCSKEGVTLYFNDGYVLFIDYDSTT